ncbi:hypothetical protein GQ44DRAFT_631303 [Phaeosphaeriaceae sp. PMI808]|nr:hypothetical protein GQ44DRAFT_631303 [Phaeosphaeriaceae sp. PMI808]
MSQSSTIAARCVALTTGCQIIAYTGSFARRVRGSRHTINAVNSELLAIKTFLEIAQDDFSASGVIFPASLLEAVSDILGCCSTSSEELHKPVLRLTASGTQNEDWERFRNGDLPLLQRDLEVLRSVLDLGLDHISIFTNRTSLRSPTFENTGNLLSELLARNDLERERIKDLDGENLLTLSLSLDKFKASTESMLEMMNGDEIRHRKRSDPLDLSSDDAHQSRGRRPTRTHSPESTMTKGIGAWLTNVSSYTVQRPNDRPEHSNIQNLRKVSSENPRRELNLLRGTFYTESITPGSRSQSSGPSKPKKSRSSPRNESPHTVMQTWNFEKPTTCAASTTLNSVVSLLYQNITSDKIAIAKSKRKELSQDQKVAIDWGLCHIVRTTSPADVERMLWEGANPNVKDPEFGFLVIRAAFELSVDAIQLLLEYGAEIVRKTPNQYFDAIHAAVLGKRMENVQFLVEMGVPIETANTNGETPLHLAIKTPGAYPIAKYLLEMGSDVNIGAKEAGTPLQIALSASKLHSRERSAMVELLLSHGAEGELNAESCVRRGKGLSVLGLI